MNKSFDKLIDCLGSDGHQIINAITELGSVNKGPHKFVFGIGGGVARKFLTDRQEQITKNDDVDIILVNTSQLYIPTIRSAETYQELFKERFHALSDELDASKAEWFGREYSSGRIFLESGRRVDFNVCRRYNNSARFLGIGAGYFYDCYRRIFSQDSLIIVPELAVKTPAVLGFYPNFHDDVNQTLIRYSSSKRLSDFRLPEWFKKVINFNQSWALRSVDVSIKNDPSNLIRLIRREVEGFVTSTSQYKHNAYTIPYFIKSILNKNKRLAKLERPFWTAGNDNRFMREWTKAMADPEAKVLIDKYELECLFL